MKSIRLIFVLLSFLFLGNTATYGQTTTHELGLRLFGLDDFDFVYKKEKAENRFTRFRLAVFNFDLFAADEQSNLDLSLRAAIGWEKRKDIATDFKFIHGFEPGLTLAEVGNAQSGSSWLINPYLGYLLGFQYDISEHFYVNIETLTTIGGVFRVNDDGFDDNFRIKGGFSTENIALSLVYRFTTTKED